MIQDTKANSTSSSAASEWMCSHGFYWHSLFCVKRHQRREKASSFRTHMNQITVSKLQVWKRPKCHRDYFTLYKLLNFSYWSSNLVPVKMTHLPICCLRAFLFTRGPTPWPSFQPIFISSSTPMEDLRDKTNTPQSKFTLQTVKEGRMVLQKQAAGTQLVGCGCGSSYLAGAISSSSSVSPGIRAAWALMALAFSPASSLRLDENSWLVVISLGAMPCSLKSWQTPTTMCISSTKPEPQTSSRLFWNMFCIPERPSTQTLHRKSYKISFRWFPDIRQLLWQKRIKCYLIF